MKTVIAYVDGLNLFYAALKGKPESKWLDLRALLQKTLRGNRKSQNHTLVQIKYFSSLILGDPIGREAQEAYLRALGAHNPEPPKIEVYPGKHIRKNRIARFLQVQEKSGQWKDASPYLPRAPDGEIRMRVRQYEEKRTDVNLAAHMAADAASGRCDCVALVSLDSDFADLMQNIINIERILILPAIIKRKTGMEKNALVLQIQPRDIRQTQLPDNIGKIFRPKIWRLDGE